MSFRHKRISHGCPARSGPKGFWLKQSHSMAERSGRANSVRSRMCGRDGVAGDVIITSRRSCTRSFRRRSQQSRESGLQARRARARREKLGAWKPRTKSLEHELMLRKKYGETARKSRMRMSVEENWMKRERRYRGSYERSKDCPLLQRKCRRISWSQCSISCKRWTKKRNDLMPEHQKVQ